MTDLFSIKQSRSDMGLYFVRRTLGLTHRLEDGFNIILSI